MCVHIYLTCAHVQIHTYIDALINIHVYAQSCTLSKSCAHWKCTDTHNHWVVIIYNLYCMQSKPHVHLPMAMNMDMIMCVYNDSRNHSNCRILT